MTAPAAPLTCRIFGSMGEIGAARWQRLCDATPGGKDNPLLSFAFLAALEQSGSATAQTGWRPHHVLVSRGNEVIAAAPAYLKAHSQGEYVFDHGWADAFERAGGRYYPKLQLAVPFTPVSGPRLLGARADDRAQVLVAVRQEAARLGLSSAHMTFCSGDDLAAATAQGWLERSDRQFHWRNEGYGNFDDFLNDLLSRKRKLVRKERRDALADKDISVHCLTGSAITESHWDAFFAFYQETGARKWGRPYLTRAFFSQIGASLADRILLIFARRNGRWIAGALNFIGVDRLYGRNWGAIEHHPFLHFELCYYRAIEWAIEHRLAVVEAGAQGEHKIARGYLPVPTFSAHHIRHDGLNRAVAEYLMAEKQHMTQMDADLSDFSPFRHAMASQTPETE